MRRLIVAAMLATSAQAVQAADMPDFPVLRGAVSDGYVRPINWQGFYVGGQAAYGSADMNFAGSNKGMTERLLDRTVIEKDMQVSQWPLFDGKTSERHAAFGGFVGYNGQWDDVVLGVEASYVHGKFRGTSTSPVVGRGMDLSDSQYHIATASSTGSMEITDMGTLRGRAGYAYGNFLPYVFGGLALGNANIARSVTVTDQWGVDEAAANLATPVTLKASEAQNNHLLIGYSAGLGVDMMLWGNVFARAEWEYIRFTGSVDTSVNTVRGGLGYRF